MESYAMITTLYAKWILTAKTNKQLIKSSKSFNLLYMRLLQTLAEYWLTEVI